MKSAVLIPGEGLMHVFETPKGIRPEVAEKRLRLCGDTGRSGVIQASVDGGPFHLVRFTHSPDNPKNERARTACAMLFGWHMEFRGAVLIESLETEEVLAVIKELS